MAQQVISSLFDLQFLIGFFVAIMVFATVFTVMPMFGGSSLDSRMKSVVIERNEIRSRERARLKAERGGEASLREAQSPFENFVKQFNLQKILADDKTQAKLLVAGFRGRRPLNAFLVARFVCPIIGLIGMLFAIFALGKFADQSFTMKIFISILAAYAGFYLPSVYVGNIASKRKKSIQRAWPDGLDLILICVESGMSIEAAFNRVSQEIGIQSVELAEELVLTNSELSYLPERRAAYENLALRTGLDTVKSVSQALIQAERYGTPLAHALRVLSAESRDERMNAAEKKAAALPPKLTVPMILFFLPVLFGVILGPAIISIRDSGAFD